MLSVPGHSKKVEFGVLVSFAYPIENSGIVSWNLLFLSLPSCLFTFIFLFILLVWLKLEPTFSYLFVLLVALNCSTFIRGNAA